MSVQNLIDCVDEQKVKKVMVTPEFTKVFLGMHRDLNEAEVFYACACLIAAYASLVNASVSQLKDIMLLVAYKLSGAPDVREQVRGAIDDEVEKMEGVPTPAEVQEIAKMVMARMMKKADEQ